MIEMLNAYTTEVDAIEDAVGEVLRQLDLAGRARARSVGFLTCHSDFVKYGVVKALCEALPFDVIGCTTLGTGVNGASDPIMLSLSVLTSDDVFFSAAATDPLTPESLAGSLKATYHRAAAALPEKPSMVLALFPFDPGIGGEPSMDIIDGLAQGTPVFGIISSDHTPAQTETQVIFNGRADPALLSLVLMCGKVDPHFYITTLAPDKIQKQRAVITNSEGSVLKSVNHITPMQYLTQLGLAANGQLAASVSIPLVVDYGDGTGSAVRGIHHATEEGYLVCGGSMPENGTLAIGAMGKQDVLETAASAIDSVLAADAPNCALIFPCMSRNLALGTDILAEVEQIDAAWGDASPYHFSYAGGEVCPVRDAGGKLLNRFHNYTFVVCTF